MTPVRLEPFPIIVSNSSNPSQDRHSVGPDLDPNSLQRLLVDDKSRLKLPYPDHVSKETEDIKHSVTVHMIQVESIHQ